MYIADFRFRHSALGFGFSGFDFQFSIFGSGFGNSICCFRFSISNSTSVTFEFAKSEDTVSQAHTVEDECDANRKGMMRRVQAARCVCDAPLNVYGTMHADLRAQVFGERTTQTWYANAPVVRTRAS